MSINVKILSIVLLFLFLPNQKKKDKCLIIFLKDSKELYKVGTIGNYKDHFYLYLKYSNRTNYKENNKNPLITVPVKKNPKGTSYNLENKRKIKNLPDDINKCGCSRVKNFNLGREFKVYIEKKGGWVVFDAKKLLVEE